jgi:hypothetical protein
MSKTSAKANPMNKDMGDRNRGSEPGQEQKNERHDRQNTGNSGGSDRHAYKQGRQFRHDAPRVPRAEKGDARRTSKR